MKCSGSPTRRGGRLGNWAGQVGSYRAVPRDFCGFVERPIHGRFVIAVIVAVDSPAEPHEDPAELRLVGRCEGQAEPACEESFAYRSALAG
jgi:hypothetical protein